MKFLDSILFFLVASLSSGWNSSIQQPAPPFSLSLTTFNHAERFFDGTTTYVLTDRFIKVSKTYLLDTISTTVYSKRVYQPDTILSAINKIGLDSLKDSYFNYCVMTTSGTEYFVDYVSSSSDKHISLHHYYLRQIEDIIQIINSKLPKKYQLKYLGKGTKQDCRLK